MLLFCFPLPSIIIISSAALAALTDKGRTVAATSALQCMASVWTQHPETRVGKREKQEHPKCLTWLWQGDPNPSMVLCSWLVTHPAVSTSTPVKTTKPNSRRKAGGKHWFWRWRQQGSEWPCSGTNAASHTHRCVLTRPAETQLLLDTYPWFSHKRLAARFCSH